MDKPTVSDQMESIAWILNEINPEAVAARCAKALERSSRVLVVHEGAVLGATLQLAIETLIAPGAALALVHQRGMDDEYRDALNQLLPFEGRLEVIFSQSDPLACTSTHARIKALSGPLFADVLLHCAIATSSVSPAALVCILAHDRVEYDNDRSPTSTASERLQAINSLFHAVPGPKEIDALAAQYLTIDAPTTEFEHLVAQVRVKKIHAQELAKLEGKLAELNHELELLRSYQQARLSCAEAIRSSGGDVHIALRQASAILHRSILVEDHDFRPIYWSDFPGPAPASLSELLGVKRARLAVSQLQVGMPGLVRLGTPTSGSRLILRLGERPILGYASLLGLPLQVRAEVVETLLWLEPLLLPACRSQQTTRSLSERQMSGIIHALCDPGFTDEERADAADLIGWCPDLPHVVTFSHSDRAHAAAPNEVVALRRDARHSGLRIGVHGDGLVGLAASNKKDELAALISWALDRHQSVGVSETTVGAHNTPHAVRQARWACQIAREMGRSLVRFDDLGIEAITFPGADLTTLPALKPLRALEAAGHNVGFDATDTLRTFFACGGKIKEAADRLVVHPNTLRYRLERLTAITGIDLTDHDVTFELELALRIETGRRAWSNLNGGRQS